MLFVINEELRELAELFNKHNIDLYIVGGYVRNKILGVPDYQNVDIDLSSSATPSLVQKIIKNSDYTIDNIENPFGVIKIKYNNKTYEHATFRTEKYDVAGFHNPSNVEFIDDIEKDALRRDFKCNAVYYNIYKDEIIDPLGGVRDINNKIISTTRTPADVFNDDSERIMRMVRQAVSLGFNIDDETYACANRNSFKLKYLPKNKIKTEFEKILFADNKYPLLPNTKFAHARGVLLLAEINALKYILPMLQTIYYKNIIDDRGRNLFNHIIETFKLCEGNSIELRLALLVHDYGKAQTLIENNNFFGNEEIGEVLIEQELGPTGLEYNRKIVNNVKKIVVNQNFDNYIIEPLWKVRLFIINNYLQINNIILLKKYISLNKYDKIKFNIKKLIVEYNKIKDGVYIKGVNELNITATDIINKYKTIRTSKITEFFD